MTIRIAGFLLLVCLQVFASAKDQVDLIIEGSYVVPMTSAQDILLDGAVAVHDGQIVAIGQRERIREQYESKEPISGENRIVLPGLINAHTHAAMTLFRGVADDLELMEWLTNYIFPLEREFVDEEFVRVGTELACLEMIRGGTTTTVDMYFHPNVAAQVFETCGMRALVSMHEISQGMVDTDTSMKNISGVEEIKKLWEISSSRVDPIFSAHAIYTIPKDELVKRREIANRLGLAVNIHVAESRAETAGSLADYGTTPVSYLDEIGFLDGGVVAAHMVYPTAEEIKLLARKSIGVVHNPTSNMKLASGISPVVEMLDAGINVGLGTDGAASNNDLDMWAEIHLATLLQKVHNENPKALPAFQVLNMATHMGASAIGLGDTVGQLKAGMRADVIQLDIDDLQHVPIYDVLSHLVYVTDAHNVVNVIIDGQLVLKEGQPTTLKPETVKRKAKSIVAKMKPRLLEARQNGDAAN